MNISVNYFGEVRFVLLTLALVFTLITSSLFAQKNDFMLVVNDPGYFVIGLYGK